MSCNSRLEADEWRAAIQNNVKCLPVGPSKFLICVVFPLTFVCTTFLIFSVSNCCLNSLFLVNSSFSADGWSDWRCQRLLGHQQHDEQRHGHEEHHGKLIKQNIY